MKILVLTSRYTATRDIIDEDFGRQTRLFEALRKFGHDIDFFVADYRKFESKNTKLHGINVFVRPFGFFHFFSFISEFKKKAESGKYDLVIATSDPLWGTIGYFAPKNKARFLYDLHDNYEMYSSYNIPFFRHLDNFIIRKSSLITAVSHSLKEKIKSIRKEGVFVVQNGVDTELFKPMDRGKCRQRLKLPKNAKIIAYTGSIQRLQGIDVLADAFDLIKKEIPGLLLVIAGRYYPGEEGKINLRRKGIIYMGSLSQKDVVTLINAADVAVSPNPKNEFTKYCFPYKIVEYMACNANIASSNAGDVKQLLSGHKDCLFDASDINSMKKAILLQLDKKGKSDFRKKAVKYSWANIAKELDKIIRNKIRTR